MYYLCFVAIFIDLLVAWYQVKKKDLCGVVFSCTLALIMAIAATL
ncbi:hypothetical protein LAD12857_29170 [Lacrimispora amygdalina]|uniref:Uncharacterized protein n=1 Tax=Lacrimispora amygdalina TaxID=253257 RepID=A0ABQ5M8R3_9FIRM